MSTRFHAVPPTALSIVDDVPRCLASGRVVRALACLFALMLAVQGGAVQAQDPAAEPEVGEEDLIPSGSMSESQRIARYRSRADSLVAHMAGRIDPDDPSTGGVTPIAANLYLEKNLGWVQARLDSMMRNPKGDMFWMYPMTLIHFLAQDTLPDSFRERLREQWRTYRPYRGDTENHWAMYYTSLYLMTQLYPDQPGSTWFNGKSSATNHHEARAYLLHWMDRTTRRGQGEFDSPHYMNYFIVSMALLHGFADDPAMRLRAQMMLDYLLADFAAESLDGLYTGAFSRIYPGPLFNRWKDHSTAHAWLLFGNVPFRARRGSMMLAMSGYEPPALLHDIATNRSEPYLHRERKRTRDRLRYSDVRSLDVYKTTYVRPEYALGSIQGGLLQPIQQHTWELFWTPDDPTAGLNLLFTLHPYVSSRELAMYFPEEPKILIDNVLKSKGTYDRPDKWTGASPHEEVTQARDALVALYSIPKGTRYEHIHGFFSERLDFLHGHEGASADGRPVDGEEKGPGWIFARGGDALIAYYALAPYEWRADDGRGWRLYSPHRQNGAVVQVAPAERYPSLAAFAEAVRAQPLQVRRSPSPSVEYTTLRGDRIEVTYGETPRLNKEPIDYENWPLFGGPFLQAEPGRRRLTLQHGDRRRVLDFETLTITDTVVE